jgi:hypothetical protein
MTQSIYDEQREYTEKELSSDATWVEASKLAYKFDNGSDFTGTDEDAAKAGLELMGKFNYNMALGTIPMAAKISDATDEEKLAFYYMMDAYDKKDISTEGTARFFKNLALDPTTYVGIGTLGWGFAGKQSASVAARTGLKALLKESAKKFIQNTTAVAATEGAMFTAADDIARQEVAVEAGVQEEYDPLQTVASGAVGSAAGAGLVKGGEQLVKGVKAGARQVGKWADEGEEAMMQAAGGGTPPTEAIDTIDPEVIQKYIGAKGEEQTTASAKLDAALQNVEGDYEGPAIRGMLDTEGTLSKLEVGDEYTTRGVTSIAKDKETADTFVNRRWDKEAKGEKIYVNFESFINKPVNLGEGNKLGFSNVLDPKGGKYSFLEDEAVIPSGRKFVITKKEKIGDETHFTVKEEGYDPKGSK